MAWNCKTLWNLCLSIGPNKSNGPRPGGAVPKNIFRRRAGYPLRRSALGTKSPWTALVSVLTHLTEGFPGAWEALDSIRRVTPKFLPSASSSPNPTFGRQPCSQRPSNYFLEAHRLNLGTFFGPDRGLSPQVGGYFRYKSEAVLSALFRQGVIRHLDPFLGVGRTFGAYVHTFSFLALRAEISAVKI